MGHVVNYAYRLFEADEWEALFGPIALPYPEEYRPEPFSRDFVRHLPGWYAQKHPDEDWAETFAVWMTPGLDWRAEYADWPGALAKLDYCDRVMADLIDRDPIVVADDLDEDVSEIDDSIDDYYRALDASVEADPGRPRPRPGPPVDLRGPGRARPRIRGGGRRPSPARLGVDRGARRPRSPPRSTAGPGSFPSGPGPSSDPWPTAPTPWDRSTRSPGGRHADRPDRPGHGDGLGPRREVPRERPGATRGR